jgi:membrane-associated protease RseP (regulator of RpoE activity)
MFSPMRRGARLSMMVLAMALAAWIVTNASAFAHGGGGGGGGGHGGGGGGHGGGGHSGGGYHGGGVYHGGYYHNGNGFNGGYYPYFFGSGFYGYPGYGYGYGYGYNTGYAYPYYDGGYAYTYPAYAYSNPVYNSAPTPAQGRYLGIDEQAVNDSAGAGMKVVQVYPGSAAQLAGLQAGDVILSANGYLMQQSGNLAWIIATVPSNGDLQMNVRTARDGALHNVTARLP